jgi:hypothetical protein
MRRRAILTGAMLVVVLCPAVLAMEIDSNSIAEITTDPCHQVVGWLGYFGVSGNVAVWIDQRDPCGVGRVYGVNLDDPCHQEFLVDANAPGAYRLAMSGHVVVYLVLPVSGPQLLRVADITDQSNPFIFGFFPLIEYVSYVDVSGRVVAYSGNDANNSYRDTVYAADISDPNNIRQCVVSVLPTDHYASGLTIDGNRIIWSANYWEPNAYVQVADITNPNEPNIVTAFLPERTGFDAVDASGSWLVAHGNYQWQDRIYAVHGYGDVNNWKIETLWKQGDNGEYYHSGPRIDGPITVWVTSTWMPSFDGQQEVEYFLKAAYLTGNGGFTVSTLVRDTNEIDAADVWQSQVVWSKAVGGVTDLFKGLVKLACGDWGYKRGDLDRNCKVDFNDFAIFAEDWLECTMPDDPECEFGLFGYEGPKLD